MRRLKVVDLAYFTSAESWMVLSGVSVSGTSTTLAELFRFDSDAHSAMGTSLDDLLAGKRLDEGASDRRQGRLWRTVLDSFFPLCLLETVMLQEGVGDHDHERVPVQPLP